MDILRLPERVYTATSFLEILFEHYLLNVDIWRRIFQNYQLMGNNSIQYLLLFLFIVDVVYTGCFVELILAAADNRVSTLVVNNAINIRRSLAAVEFKRGKAA